MGSYKEILMHSSRFFIFIRVYVLKDSYDIARDNGLSVVIGVIAAIIFTIYMITDALLLVGSIKRNKVALMVGLVLSGKVILGWVVLAVWSVHSNMYAFVIPFTLLTIGLRLWTFLIGVQCYRSIAKVHVA